MRSIQRNENNQYDLTLRKPTENLKIKKQIFE